MKKGQRPHGAIEKDVDKLIKDLTIAIDHHYLNTCSNRKLMKLFKVILKRTKPQMTVEALGIFAGCTSISSVKKLSETYPVLKNKNVRFWMDIYNKYTDDLKKEK